MPLNALTHNGARAKVCIWCGDKKKSLRKITNAVQILLDSKIPDCIPARPEDDDSLPTSICDNCRKALQNEDSKHVLPPPFDYG